MSNLIAYTAITQTTRGQPEVLEINGVNVNATWLTYDETYGVSSLAIFPFNSERVLANSAMTVHASESHLFLVKYCGLTSQACLFEVSWGLLY